jgi:uncharacterized phiE125 gp8 family phage protein
MMMVEVTSVSSAVLPVAELVAQLRLSRGFADDGTQDAQLESCLRAALAAIEARIGKALFERRFALSLVHWTYEDRHSLPKAPVNAIDSIKLITRAGAETLVDPALYDLRTDRHAPMIVSTGTKLPTPSQGGAIEVEFTAGFSPDWVGIPPDLKQAVLIMAAELWGQNIDPNMGLPLAVSVLVEPYRTIRLRGGAA